MDIKTIIKFFILTVIVAYYLAYTINFAKFFRRNNFYAGRRKIFHSIMIWLVPFLWIKIIKALLRPTPGSYAFKKRSDTSRGMKKIGILGLLGLSSLDSANHGQGHNGHSYDGYGYDSSGHNSFGMDSTSVGDFGGGDGGGGSD